MNACLQKRRMSQDTESSIPGRFFNYLGLCKKFKESNEEVKELESSRNNILPIVSGITEELSTEAAIMIQWSFLKY